MNFQFIVTAHGFDKAGKIEATLKEMGIPFIVKQMSGPSGTVRGTKAKVDKILVAAIVLSHQSHPTWTHKQISDQHKVSHATVGRILNGTHVLQAQGEK